MTKIEDFRDSQIFRNRETRRRAFSTWKEVDIEKRRENKMITQNQTFLSSTSPLIARSLKSQILTLPYPSLPNGGKTLGYEEEP
jgi:hypothetical protein